MSLVKMPFEPRSKEQIYSDLVTAGAEAGFLVVPEFTLPYNFERQKRAKRADIAWLVTAEGSPEYGVVAAFEVEGFDVPLTTIDLHSEVYAQVREFFGLKFPCCVPIYSQATHRPRYGRNLELVEACVGERIARAAYLNNVVEVCDGTRRDWLVNVSTTAKGLADTWLQQRGLHAGVEPPAIDRKPLTL